MAHRGLVRTLITRATEPYQRPKEVTVSQKLLSPCCRAYVATGGASSHAPEGECSSCGCAVDIEYARRVWNDSRREGIATHNIATLELIAAKLKDAEVLAAGLFGGHATLSEIAKVRSDVCRRIMDLRAEGLR